MKQLIKRRIVFASIFFLALLFMMQRSDAAIISEARIMGFTDKFYDSYVKPIKGAQTIKAVFKESSHKGSYYEIGKSLARYLLTVNPGYKESVIALIDSICSKDDQIRKTDVSVIVDKTKIFFPEILDEIRGFAEVMGIEQDDAVRVYTQYGVTRFMGCTIVAVSKEHTKDGSILVGRNYDWLPTMCDLHLVGTEPHSGYKSMGVSEFAIGRLDGINEKGLFIGITAVKSRDSDKNGFFFPLVVRAVLDKAKNVDEAVNIIQMVPHSDGTNFLIADKFGNAAVVEAAPGETTTVRWLKDSKEGLLIATNHYVNKGTSGENEKVMPNSYERIRILKRLLKDKAVTPSDLSSVLTSASPDGVFNKTYDTGFGTLYSEICDLSKGSLLLRAGGFEGNYTVSPLSLRDSVHAVIYDNKEIFIPDFIDASGFNPVDLNSFFFRYAVMFIATPVLAPVVEANVSFKAGLGTERTYGPHVNIGIYTFITPAFARAGLQVSFNPSPLFSLEITPFYYAGWKVYRFLGASDDIAHTVNRYLNSGRNEYHVSPALMINPVFRLGPVLILENRFTLYHFSDYLYEYRSFLLVRRSMVWTPSLQILIPYSGGFLWGMTGEANVELTKMRYNVQAGPLLVFPRLFRGLTLAVAPTFWIHLSEGHDRFNLIVVVRGQLD